MATVGNYLYGFTDRRFQLRRELRGVGGAPVHVLAFGEVAAVVSRHPVQPLMPLRSNLEPHHRIVREISSEATLVPAAFGHISETEGDILGVVRGNYDDIREALRRLDAKCEMGLKLCWTVDNIFEYLVRTDARLRELRDRVFRRAQPVLNEKLQVGELFEITLRRERERLGSLLLGTLDATICDVVRNAPRDEKTVCHAALLIERARIADFQLALRRAGGLFDSNFTLEVSGPWPPYSFARLHLQPAAPTAAA
jgi:hypothetical protein